MLKKVRHPNVIRMVEIVDTPKQINIITEHINGPSLHHHLKHQGGVNRKLSE